MVRRKLLTSPRLRKKKQKALFEKAAVLLSLCVALFFAVLYFFNADYISIKSIEVLSADSNIDSVKSIVEEELKRQKFGMFPQNNFIFLSGDNLTAAVQKVFPEVLQIDAKFNGINDLIVEVKYKSTFAIWCDEDEKLCFDIDETGIAFKDFEGNGSSTPLVLVSNDKPVLSQKITSDQRFLKIGMFITAFQKRIKDWNYLFHLEWKLLRVVALGQVIFVAVGLSDRSLRNIMFLEAIWHTN